MTIGEYLLNRGITAFKDEHNLVNFEIVSFFEPIDILFWTGVNLQVLCFFYDNDRTQRFRPALILNLESDLFSLALVS